MFNFSQNLSVKLRGSSVFSLFLFKAKRLNITFPIF